MFCQRSTMGYGQFDMFKFCFLTHGNKQSVPQVKGRSSPAKPKAHQEGVCGFIYSLG